MADFVTAKPPRAIKGGCLNAPPPMHISPSNDERCHVTILAQDDKRYQRRKKEPSVLIPVRPEAGRVLGYLTTLGTPNGIPGDLDWLGRWGVDSPYHHSKYRLSAVVLFALRCWFRSHTHGPLSLRPVVSVRSVRSRSRRNGSPCCCCYAA